MLRVTRNTISPSSSEAEASRTLTFGLVSLSRIRAPALGRPSAPVEPVIRISNVSSLSASLSSTVSTATVFDVSPAVKITVPCLGSGSGA